MNIIKDFLSFTKQRTLSFSTKIKQMENKFGKGTLNLIVEWKKFSMKIKLTSGPDLSGIVDANAEAGRRRADLGSNVPNIQTGTFTLGWPDDFWSFIRQNFSALRTFLTTETTLADI
jgi:hypothetical protein